MGLDKKDFFYGKIDFLQIYSSDVPTELLEAIVNNIKILPKPGVTPGDETYDGRKLSLIHIRRCRRIERCRSWWSGIHYTKTHTDKQLYKNG